MRAAAVGDCLNCSRQMLLMDELVGLWNELNISDEKNLKSLK